LLSFFLSLLDAVSCRRLDFTQRMFVFELDVPFTSVFFSGPSLISLPDAYGADVPQEKGDLFDPRGSCVVFLNAVLNLYSAFIFVISFRGGIGLCALSIFKGVLLPT